MSGLLCAGDVYVDRLTDAGVKTGRRKIGNATLLSLQESTETVQRISKERSTYGQAKDTVQIKQPTQLQLNVDEIDHTNLALAMLGEASTVTVASGSVTDEACTARVGGWVQLSKRAISSVVVVVGGSGVISASGNYEVDARLGMIRVLEDGVIPDGTAMEVSFSYAAQTVQRVAGASKPTIRAEIFLDGKNLATGEEIYLTIDETTLTPTSAVDFLSSEFVELELQGTPKTLDGRTSPYTADTKAAA